MPKRPRVAPEKAREILRELSPSQAFYFYEGIGAPSGTTARSLGEFVERVSTVSSASLQFHMSNQDFERWITMLGDGDLTAKLASIRASRVTGDELRPRLLVTVKNRVDQLNRARARQPR